MTLGNTDGKIGGLTISDPPTRAEVQALRDKAEELAADLRNLSTLIHSLRTALVAEGSSKAGHRRPSKARRHVVNNVRALATLAHALRAALVAVGVVKGGA